VCQKLREKDTYVEVMYPVARYRRYLSISLQEIGTFHLMARKLLVPGLSVTQIASFFTKYVLHRDHRSHLTGFCGVNLGFISPHVITRGYSGDFDRMGLSR
jgi:hypothetical protein